MNLVSVSFGDHLSFGEGDGRLDTPEKVARRMPLWRDELGAQALHWRLLRSRTPGRFEAAPGYEHPSQKAARSLGWNDLEEVPSLAHAAGLEAWMYVSLFDEGWPLASAQERAVSHHNSMHGQHVAWQSDLTRAHPEWVTVDRSGARQWGVVSLAYPAARRAFIDRWTTFMASARFDGLFVCLRSQSRPAEHADQFGFGDQVCADFHARLGVDILTEEFDRQPWRRLQGEYLTMLLVELRAAMPKEKAKLGIGVARGDVLGPPLGNTEVQWRDWVRHGLVDQLVINQSSSQCPSMWHQLWPMHRGHGYVQNYLDGTGLPPLADHVAKTYGPVAEGTGTQLLVARQWDGRDEKAESELRGTAGVTGLVFSSFRHDNPGPIARGNWHAGRVR